MLNLSAGVKYSAFTMKKTHLSSFHTEPSVAVTSESTAMAIVNADILRRHNLPFVDNFKIQSHTIGCHISVKAESSNSSTFGIHPSSEFVEFRNGRPLEAVKLLDCLIASLRWSGRG